MAKAGRKPKPPQLKVVEGNPGKRAIPDAPQPQPKAPSTPKWSKLLPGKANQSVRGEAQREWKRIVPVLDRLGLLSEIDGALLQDYVICWARLVDCERRISKDGMTVLSYRGGEKAHPLLTVANQYRQQLRFYVGELGLGPSSRGRLQIPGEPDDDQDLFDT